jgi:hypothetical protein
MKLLLAGVLLVLALPAAAVYKCQTVDGKTTFQEIPCAIVEKQTDVRTFASPPSSPATTEASAALRTAINQAIVGSYPVRGMNLKELQSAIGEPTRINTGDYQGGFTEQRIYERAGGTTYVYTENGIVRSIETSESQRRAVPEQQARNCASAQEIKNEEVSANSITLTADQRQQRNRKIQRMRECKD